jgi:hypothetical protein
MFWFCVALSAAGVLEPAICSCLVAEFAGYWLHRRLHSEKTPFRGHSQLAHHLLRYGPVQAMSADKSDDPGPGGLLPVDRLLRTRLTRPDHSLNRKSLAIALLRYRLATPLHTLGRDSTQGGRRRFND